MTSTAPPPSRGYEPLGQLPASMRSSQPMPAPLSRVALAAKQNQILALQALQAAAASASASASVSSASSSNAGSPPPATSYLKPSVGTVQTAGAKRGRKFQAFRAPALVASPLASSLPHSSAQTTAKLTPLITTSVPHWSAEGSHPLFDPSSGKRSEIYSLTNDRYPGAPGTALAKAREAQQKALQTAKREAAKKLASKAELEHLGVKGLGKKRKSSSPYATVGATANSATAVQVDPVYSASTSRAVQEYIASQAMSRDSSRSRSSAKPAASDNTLTVPSVSRSRRPASRASSPAPAMAQAPSARRSGTRSGSTAPSEEDAIRNSRGSPSRGTSPPDQNKSLHGLSSTAPFQSSPLAASAITMEPLLDTEDAEQNSAKPDASLAEVSVSAARAASSAKRKASALSQEVQADNSVEVAAADALDETSKRLKRDGDETSADPAGHEAPARHVKEGSPSSVSSSRRTSPRMSSRRIVAEAA